MDQSKVIAVDFNRTLVSEGGPDPSKWGSPEPDAKWALDKLKEAGFTICINSVVGDKQALAGWLKQNQMPYDHINESPAQPEGSNSTKINAVAYIDDRAVPYRGDWKQSLGDLFASGILTKRRRKTKKSWEVCDAYCTCPNCRESGECEQCLQGLGAGAAKVDATERKRKGLEKAPCKPGQNTNNSDCTPASGGGSGSKPQEATTSSKLTGATKEQEESFNEIQGNLEGLETEHEDIGDGGFVTHVTGQDGKPLGKIVHNPDGSLDVDEAVTKLTGIEPKAGTGEGYAESQTATGKAVAAGFDKLAGLVGKGAAAFDNVMSTIGSIGNGIAYAASDEGVSAAKSMLAKWLGDKADQLGDKVEGYASGLAHMLDQAKQTTSANVKDAWKETLKGVAKVIAAAGGKSHMSDSEIDKGLGDWFDKLTTAGPVYVREGPVGYWYVHQGQGWTTGSPGAILDGPFTGPDGKRQALDSAAKEVRDQRRYDPGVRLVAAGEPDVEKSLGSLLEDPDFQVLVDLHKNGDDFGQAANDVRRVLAGKHDLSTDAVDAHAAIRKGGVRQKGALLASELDKMPDSHIRGLYAKYGDGSSHSRDDMIEELSDHRVVSIIYFGVPGKSISKAAFNLPDSPGAYSVYTDSEGDMMKVEKKPDGGYYGISNTFDFWRQNAAEAASQLQKWGYKYVGQERKSMKVNKDAHYVKSQTVPARFLKWDDESNSADFVISTEEVDRDGDTLDMDGLDVTEYKGNPVVCLNHDTDDIAIGRADDPLTGELMIRKEDVDGKPALVSRVYFNMEDEKARRVANAVKGGFMRAASVSFDPVEDGTEKNRYGGSHYRKWKLIEWSVVTVPANAQAVRHVRAMCKSLGVKMVQKSDKTFQLSFDKQGYEAQLKGMLKDGWSYDDKQMQLGLSKSAIKAMTEEEKTWLKGVGRAKEVGYSYDPFEDPDEMLPDEFRKSKNVKDHKNKAMGWSFWLNAVASAANLLVGNYVLGGITGANALLALLDSSEEEELEDLWEDDVDPQEAARKIAPKLKSKSNKPKGRKPGKERSVKRKLFINRAWHKKGIVLKADLPGGEVDEEIAEYLDDNGVTDVTVADEAPPVEEYAEVVEGEDKGFLQPGHAGVKLGVQPRGAGFALVDQDGDESRETFASADEARAAAPQYGTLKSDDGGKMKASSQAKQVLSTLFPGFSSIPSAHQGYVADDFEQMAKDEFGGDLESAGKEYRNRIGAGNIASYGRTMAVGKSNGGAGVSKSDDEVVEALAEKYDSKMDDDQLDKLMDEEGVPEAKRYRMAKRLKSFQSKTGFKALDKWIKAIEDDLAEVEQQDVLGAAEKALKLLRSAKAKAYPEAAEIATKADEALADLPEEEAVAKEDEVVEEAMEEAEVPEEKRWQLKRMVKSILFEKRFDKSITKGAKVEQRADGFYVVGDSGNVLDGPFTTEAEAKQGAAFHSIAGTKSKRLSKADEECVSGLEEEMKSMASGTDLPKHLKGTVGGWAEKLANLKRKAEAPVPETMDMPPEELSKIKAIEDETEKMRKTWKDLSMTMFGN